jgi:hypothetical protein
MQEYNSALSGLTLAAWVLVPVAYYVFVAAFERAVERFAQEPKKVQGSLKLMAAFTAVPGLGSIIEIVLLYRLAREASRLPGARDRSSLVLALAFARPIVGILVTPLVGVFAYELFTDAWMIFIVANPLLNLAVLAVITQVLVTPLLDQMMPAGGSVDLAAAGAASPMAVSSTTRGADER